MKINFRLIQFAILLLTLVSTATAVFADVKIKTRQTDESGGAPSEYTTYIKGKRQRMESGDETISIMQCDLRRSIQLLPAAKSYLVTLFGQPDSKTDVVKMDSPTQTTVVERGGTVTTTYTTKDTGERKQMFGYTARRIVTTIESKSSPDACRKDDSKMEMDMWVIDAEFAIDCYDEMNAGYVPPVRNGCQDKYVTKNVGTARQGFQLYAKTTMYDDDGKITHTSVSEVVELSKATLDAALFDVPAGFREVKNSSELYASMSSDNANKSGSATLNSTLQMPQVPGAEVSSPVAVSGANVKSAPVFSSNAVTAVGAKKAGVVRLGVADVKTSVVGEGVSAAELSAAVQNTLGEYLKMPNVEVVRLESKLPSAIDAEAKEKECDFVIFATVSHKKGGGGGGFFGKALGKLSENVAERAYGSGNTVGKVSQITIMTAAAASGSVKAKDQVTLEVRLVTPGNASPIAAKQFQGKARSDGEDVITPLIEQAAQMIVDASAKK